MEEVEVCTKVTPEFGECKMHWTPVPLLQKNSAHMFSENFLEHSDCNF